MNVLADRESIVNEVAKAIVGEKLIVCGRAARWWDAEVKAKIEHRRDVYRKIAGGQDELWKEYYKLRQEHMSRPKGGRSVQLRETAFESERL